MKLETTLIFKHWPVYKAFMDRYASDAVDVMMKLGAEGVPEDDDRRLLFIDDDGYATARRLRLPDLKFCGLRLVPLTPHG